MINLRRINEEFKYLKKVTLVDENIE